MLSIELFGGGVVAHFVEAVEILILAKSWAACRVWSPIAHPTTMTCATMGEEVGARRDQRRSRVLSVGMESEADLIVGISKGLAAIEPR